MYIYHERQLGLLCGVHCLNNLLQGPYFGPGDLAEIAFDLDSQERLLFDGGGGCGAKADSRGRTQNIDPSADGGHFSLQVLAVALGRFGLELLPSGHPDVRESMRDPPAAAEAFLCQRDDHWFAVRRIGACWWNLNSTQQRPGLVGPERLTESLTQLTAAGHSVFLIRGSEMPMPAQPERLGGDIKDNFHSLAELMRPGAKQFVESWGRGRSTSGPEAPEPDPQALRDMCYADAQVRAAVALGKGKGSEALQLLSSAQLPDSRAGQDAAWLARELSVALMALESSMQGPEVLRLVSLLSSSQEQLQAAAGLVDFAVLSKFLSSISEHAARQGGCPEVREAALVAKELLDAVPAPAAPSPAAPPAAVARGAEVAGALPSSTVRMAAPALPELEGNEPVCLSVLEVRLAELMGGSGRACFVSAACNRDLVFLSLRRARGGKHPQWNRLVVCTRSESRALRFTVWIDHFTKSEVLAGDAELDLPAGLVLAPRPQRVVVPLRRADDSQLGAVHLAAWAAPPPAGQGIT